MLRFFTRGLILLFLTTMISLQAFAQDTALQGRVVSQQDWLDRIPLIIAVIAITILIDVVFIFGFRKRN